MIRAASTLLLAAAVSSLLPDAAVAQTGPAGGRPRTAAPSQRRAVPQRDRFEVSFGGLWIGGALLNSANAETRANSTTATPFRLFTTQTRAAPSAGLDARVGYWLTRSLGIEGGVVRVQPELRTSVSGDYESGNALTATERLDQYFIDANVVWLIDDWRFGQTVPFVSGGAGYLRQLHEGRTLVETGTVYNVGGGVRHPLAVSPGWSMGIKADGRIYILAGGVELEERTRTHGALAGAVYFTF